MKAKERILTIRLMDKVASKSGLCCNSCNNVIEDLGIDNISQIKKAAAVAKAQAAQHISRKSELPAR